VIFLVDRDEAARAAVRGMLEGNGWAVKSFADGDAFLKAYQPGRGVCLVIEADLPDMSGLAVMRRLQDAGDRTPAIMIAATGEVSMAVTAMKAGASDFIEKPFDGDVIVHAVRRCLETSESLGAKQARRHSIDQRLSMLTDRERQVFDALVEGLSNQEIGLSLRISPRTVEIHRARIMAKMNAQSLSELVRMAIENRAA
jgi:FixJ family two-component response regulator